MTMALLAYLNPTYCNAAPEITEIHIGSDSIGSSTGEEVIILNDTTEVTTIDESEAPRAGDKKEEFKNNLANNIKTIAEPETPGAGPSGTNRYLFMGIGLVLVALASFVLAKSCASPDQP